MTQPSPSPLRDYLSYTLEHYLSKGSFRDDRVRFVEAATAAQEALLQQPTLQAAAAIQDIKSSFGKGTWAFCPWMAILDNRETRTTQSGVYIAWLFRADMSGVYLTLAQGVTEVQKVHQGDSLEVLHAEADKVRAVTGLLVEQGFSNEPISLGSGNYAKAYEASMILQKFYACGALPTERELLEDVDVLFQAYSTYLGQKAPPTSSKEAQALPSITQDLQQAFSGRGLTYTNEQAEMFFTALQTKGFVVISGISGTGKSKIAQAFADLCQTSTPPAPSYPETLRKKVTPSDLQNDRSLTIPRAHWADFGLQSIFAPDRVLVTLNGVTGDCRLARTNPTQLEVKLSGLVWEEFQRQFQVGDGYWLLPTRPAGAQDPSRPLEVRLIPTLPGPFSG